MKKVGLKLVNVLMFLVSILPFRVLYFLSDFLFYLIFYLVKYRRTVVHTNLLKSFPDKSKIERYEIEKRFYKHLLDLIFESIKTMSISREQIQKRFVIKNPEVITNYTDSGQSVIAVSGHYGNWEWGSLAFANSLNSNVLIVYKPLSNKGFEHILNRMRARFGSILVPMKQTLRKVIEYKSQTSIVFLVGDQTPPREESNYFTRFLNQQTAVFLGIEKIALKTNYPIIYFNISKVKRGYYECTYKLLVDLPETKEKYEITNIHTQELENIIRNKPEYWLWSHRRWKFSPEN